MMVHLRQAATDWQGARGNESLAIYPLYLAFEFSASMLLRDKQVECVKKLVESVSPPRSQSVVRQTIMGFGKSQDGTLGANKNAIKMIAKETNLYAQGYFAYDALKAGGITCSHLRFSPKPIKSCYEVSAGAKYVGIHKKEYTKSLSADTLLSVVEPGGILVLNSPWTDPQSLRENLPLGFRRKIVKQGFVFYNLDASSVARRAGMGRMINNIMQTVVFHLAQVMDAEKAITIFKTAVSKTYKSKGPEVVHDRSNRHVAC